MEYSVGSLAELISGSKTPNKTKVVKTAFTPLKKADESQSLSENAIKKSKSPKKIKKNKIKSEAASFSDDNIDNSLTSLKKVKIKSKNKKKKIITNLNTDDSFTDPIQLNPKKQKKRKLEKSKSDLADSDAEEETPKKQKLGENEKNAASRIKNKINQENKTSADYKDRTLFVGNIPISIKKKKLVSLFKKYGPINSIRIRGIPVADPKTTKKVAAIKNEFHPDRKTVYAFIRFYNSEDAKKAEAENGELFHGNHLRVHFCESNDKPEESKAIFIGNLAFSAEEEELWDLFKTCGPISHVRIVRDGRTNMGRGFAYVNFKDSDSVQLALEMEKVVLKDRELRISACDSSRASKKKMGKKPRYRNIKKSENQENGDNSPKERSNDGNLTFSGSKFNDSKKKKKFSKAALEKKKIAKKLAAPSSQKS